MALDAFLLVIGMLALGKVCAATGRFPPAAAGVLNLFVLDICLPAAVLRYASRLELDLSLLRVIAVPWLLCALAALVVYAGARIKARAKATLRRSPLESASTGLSRRD